VPVFENLLICVDDFYLENDFLNYLVNVLDLFKNEKININIRITQKTTGSSSNATDPEAYKEEIEKVFSGKLNNYLNCSYDLGSTSEDMVIKTLKFLSQNNIDLLILKFTENNQEEAMKIIRSSACSVLYVSSVLPDKLENILIPIDFSDKSKLAFAAALKYAEIRKLKFILTHVYFVPEGYHSLGKSYEEMAVLIKSNAKKMLNEFIKEVNLMNYHISPSFILDDDKDPTDKIYKEATDHEADMIIMSSKGKTASGNTILGRTAKTIILYNDLIPLLILKNKKENADMADYIWKTNSIN
jgi:nucleotide-binding universal stress UspA family protein